MVGFALSSSEPMMNGDNGDARRAMFDIGLAKDGCELGLIEEWQSCESWNDYCVVAVGMKVTKYVNLRC